MASKNSIIPADKQKFSVFISSEGMKNKINQMLGGRDGSAFIASIVSAVSANPMLAGCDNTTILSAALLGNSLNLSPSAALGQYFIVPYKDKNNSRIVGQFQIGYKGYIQLAIRTGQYRRLNVVAIKEGELVKYDELEETIAVNLIDDEEAREKTATIGYYAFFELVNGFRKTLYWSRRKMERHALRYSRAYAKKQGASFWLEDFDEMAKKTMLRQLISKWGPMSVDLEKAFNADMASIDANGNYDYVDSLADDAAAEVQPSPAAEPEPAPVEPAVTSSADGNAILFG